MITIPGRIPITIHPLFWLIAFFIGWMWTSQLSETLICVLVILFSVIFHELGHALTSIFFGQKTRVELAAFGGFTYREGRKLKLWEEFFVVLNGPLAGLALSFFAYLLYRNWSVDNPLLSFVIKFTFSANLFWTLVNLVPVLPLDGGHLLSILLEAIFGFKGIKFAIVLGITLAIALSIVFFVLGMFLMVALFLILSFESLRSLKYYRMFTEEDRDVGTQQLMQTANQEFAAGNMQAALEKLKAVRDKTKEGILYSMATQEMAEIYKNQEQFEEAYRLLLPIENTLSGDTLALFHFLAYMNGDFKRITANSSKCYQEHPTYDTALINAFAFGALAKAEPAVGWLECALREGLPSIHQAIAREEFDPIRSDPRFLAFEKAHQIAH
jgi:Zn-dependent protease